VPTIVERHGAAQRAGHDWVPTIAESTVVSVTSAWLTPFDDGWYRRVRRLVRLPIPSKPLSIPGPPTADQAWHPLGLLGTAR
jgi:hypothetical protein